LIGAIRLKAKSIILVNASGTDWCQKFNVKGYYVRIETGEVLSRFQKNVHVKNVLAAEDTRLASHLVSPDALALACVPLTTHGFSTR
jgi:hypothetical protein